MKKSSIQYGVQKDQSPRKQTKKRNKVSLLSNNQLLRLKTTSQLNPTYYRIEVLLQPRLLEVPNAKLLCSRFQTLSTILQLRKDCQLIPFTRGTKLARKLTPAILIRRVVACVTVNKSCSNTKESIQRKSTEIFQNSCPSTETMPFHKKTSTSTSLLTDSNKTKLRLKRE